MPSQVESICSLPSGLLAPPGWDDLRDVLVDRRPRVVQRRRLQDDPGRPNWGRTDCFCYFVISRIFCYFVILFCRMIPDVPTGEEQIGSKLVKRCFLEARYHLCFLCLCLSSLGISFPIQGSSGNVCGPVMRILGISRIFCCHIYLGIWIFATLCREYLKETWFREQNMGMLTKSEDKAMSPTSCYCGSPDQAIRH